MDADAPAGADSGLNGMDIDHDDPVPPDPAVACPTYRSQALFPELCIHRKLEEIGEQEGEGELRWVDCEGYDEGPHMQPLPQPIVRVCANEAT